MHFVNADIEKNKSVGCSNSQIVATFQSMKRSESAKPESNPVIKKFICTLKTT